MTHSFAKFGRSALSYVINGNSLKKRPWFFHQSVTISVSVRPVCRRPLLVNQNFPFVKHCFHTTPCRRIHPVFLFILRPLSKFLAVIIGRRFRIWWQALPESEKNKVWEKIRARRRLLMGLLGGFVCVLVGTYVTHLEETPITKRRRFILLNPEQFGEISEILFETQLELLQTKIVKTDHPSYKLVTRVANRLLEANRDLPQVFSQAWSITIVESEEQNAFVLPSGQIFVFTGMLKVCNNEDQLGVVLGHEMAHAVLGHTAELLSYSNILDMFMVLIVAAAWAFFPTDWLSGVAHILSTQLKKLILELPYSRMLEVEADEVGLLLAAKACFDIRESSAFWSKMHVLSEMKSDLMLEWLSTHPNHETRVATLENKLPENLQVRSKLSCPPLPRTDPRDTVSAFREWAKKQEEKKRKELSVPLVVVGPRI